MKPELWSVDSRDGETMAYLTASRNMAGIRISKHKKRGSTPELIPNTRLVVLRSYDCIMNNYFSRAPEYSESSF